MSTFDAPKIRNTASPQDVELTALLALANAMGRTDDDPMSNLILGQEADGQAQLVRSEQLPTRGGGPDEEYEAVGIVFGAPDPGDQLFRPATLPQGWKKIPTDHSMWSKVIDQYGRERISIFYKAAFYDRDAFMRLTQPSGYLRNVVADGGQPILDDQWLTADVAVKALTDLEHSELAEADEADGYANSTDRNDTYWRDRAAEHRADAAKYAAMRAQIEASAA